MIVELVLLALSVALSPMLAWRFTSRYRSWKRRNIVLLAALPLPMLALTFAGVTLAIRQVLHRGDCEPEVCDLAMALAVTGLIVAPILYAVNLALAGVTVFLARNADTRAIDKTFQ